MPRLPKSKSRIPLSSRASPPSSSGAVGAVGARDGCPVAGTVGIGVVGPVVGATVGSAVGLELVGAALGDAVGNVPPPQAQHASFALTIELVVTCPNNAHHGP